MVTLGLKHVLTVVLVCLSLSTANAADNCWETASEAYGVPADLLYAIALTESNLNPDAVNQNRDGTVDVGIMQINSFWFDVLARFDISPDELMDPCKNIMVGAWILAQEVDRYGMNWKAIGAYNAGAYGSKNRETKIGLYKKYASKVYENYRRAFGAERSGRLRN